jgi:para-nitrobenzyl esterase
MSYRMYWRAGRLAAVISAALLALPIAASTADAADSVAPIVTINNGKIRGAAVDGGYAFRGLPYAAAPVGDLRWRAPRPSADWRGVRDATQYAPSSPQSPSPFAPEGPQSEDSLYLNVSTPTLRGGARKPVIVWIHGGGLTGDGARNYDATKLAADGTVVVTLNYRLGLLGVLAHPALANADGSTGNYGLMDQQAALRWVRRNIARFGGDPHNVTIAGQSAGGLSVLAHMVSRDSRGLFQRAIVMSGAFALNQQPLAEAEAQNQALLDRAGITDQSAAALRRLPVETLVNALSGAAIPGVVDGKVLTESIGSALASGRFAHVPLLTGVVHNENRLFVGLRAPVVNGHNVMLPEPVTPESYPRVIAAVLGVSPERAAAIVAEYPLSAYPSPTEAFSAVVSDAGFVHGALELERAVAKYAPVFAYSFDDDSAPLRYTPPTFLPQVATHSSDVQYYFDLPHTPVPASLSADQERLASSMRKAWTNFAAGRAPWPEFGSSERVMTLNTTASQIETTFASDHHDDLWQ